MNIIREIGDFLFPRFCVLCDKRLSVSEHHLCATCYMYLPRTRQVEKEHGRLERILWGMQDMGNGQRVIERAATFIFYTSNSRLLLHKVKYEGMLSLGIQLGEWMAKEMIDASHQPSIFDSIDVIVPLPLHRKKQMSRGYNQCDYIAKGVSKVTGIGVDTQSVKRVHHTPSQTTLDHEARRKNVAGAFAVVHPERLEGKHVLLLDDVITTGSTIMECANAILKLPGTKVTILAVAHADKNPVPESVD